MTTIPVRETIKIIGDILKQQMDLTDEQIMLAYSKYDIPETPGIYIALSYVSGKAIANNNVALPNTNVGMIEYQSITVHEIIQIDALSFDSSARVRKEEILMALRSIFSEQQQEKYNFQIARLGGEFINASSLEVTKYLNRFTTNIAVTSVRNMTKVPEYFDQFDNAEVVTNL